MSLLYVALAAAVVVVLLVLEQVALLYILSTLAVSALLIIVAFADIRGAGRRSAEAPPADDSAAIGDRTAKVAPATSFGQTAPRAARAKRGR